MALLNRKKTDDDKGKLLQTVAMIDYLGSYGNHKKSFGNLFIYEETIIFKKGWMTHFQIPKSQVKDICIEGSDVANSRFTATRILALGVFALAFKKKQKQAFITIELIDGQEVMFMAKKMANELKATLSQVIQAYRKNEADAPTPLSNYDQLAKLAELHKQGVLTTDEFNKEKAKVLGK